VVAEELVPGPGVSLCLRAPERHALSPPSCTFNFVCVRGAEGSRPAGTNRSLAAILLPSKWLVSKAKSYDKMQNFPEERKWRTKFGRSKMKRDDSLFDDKWRRKWCV
jgi:hypothetical protein